MQIHELHDNVDQTHYDYILHDTLSYLARVVQSLPNKPIDKCPGHDQTKKQVPLNLSHLLNTTASMQNLIPTEYLCHRLSVITVPYLPPELLHSCLSVSLANIVHGGHWLRVGNTTLRAPAGDCRPATIYGNCGLENARHIYCGFVCLFHIRAAFYPCVCILLMCVHSTHGCAF